jgi:hypothetical protein
MNRALIIPPEANQRWEEIADRQNATILKLSAALSEMNSLANQLGANLQALVDAHDENDQEAIATQLKRLSDYRKQFVKQKAQVH